MRKLPHLYFPSKTASLVPEFPVEDLPLGRTETVVPVFAVKNLSLDRTLWWWWIVIIHIYTETCLLFEKQFHIRLIQHNDVLWFFLTVRISRLYNEYNWTFFLFHPWYSYIKQSPKIKNFRVILIDLHSNIFISVIRLRGSEKFYLANV